MQNFRRLRFITARSGAVTLCEAFSHGQPSVSVKLSSQKGYMLQGYNAKTKCVYNVNNDQEAIRNLIKT
jgi:hypothetical protein